MHSLLGDAMYHYIVREESTLHNFQIPDHLTTILITNEVIHHYVALLVRLYYVPKS